MKSFAKGFESRSAHWFKCIEKNSVDSQFETNTLMVCYKQDHKVTNKIYFIHQFNFLCNFYESPCPIPIQNNMHWWWIEIKENHKYKLYGNTGNCQKQPFEIIGVTPRGTLGLGCAHIAQLITHPAIYTLPFTLKFCNTH